MEVYAMEKRLKMIDMKGHQFGLRSPIRVHRIDKIDTNEAFKMSNKQAIIEPDYQVRFNNKRNYALCQVKLELIAKIGFFYY
jgi:hypothetical protein